MKDKRILTLPVTYRSDNGGVFVGTAVKYNSLSEPLGGFRETFLPGSLREHLATNPDIVATIDHDFKRLLARTSSGTLKLVDTDDGLQVECSDPGTSYAKDLAISISRNDIRGMSFIFDCDRSGEAWTKRDGTLHHEVSKARIYEVSFVTFPAYPQTDASMRSLQEYLEYCNRRYFLELAERE